MNHFNRFILIMLMIFTPFASNIASEVSMVIEETNFKKLSNIMKKENKGLLLMIHSEHCHYCKVMDEAVLTPMIHSGEYKNRIFIRKLQVDKGDHVFDFKGIAVSAFDVASSFDAHFTPTLLFINKNGIEQTEKLVGLNSIDFIGARIDRKIDELMNIGHSK